MNSICPVAKKRMAKKRSRAGWLWPVLFVSIIYAVALLAFPMLCSAETIRVSVDSSGIEGNDATTAPFISGNGRYVAFHSAASNLVTGDTNFKKDIFLYDCMKRQTTRVSVDSSGAEANNESYDPCLTPDGRYVAFESRASNLVPDDTNGYWDIFVHDRKTGATSRVSVSSSGEEANHECDDASISDDGNFVAFSTYASNLVPNDLNSAYDIFVHDRQTGVTSRVSVDSSGTESNGNSDDPRISGNGRYVVFESDATNLVLNDTNGRTDIFVHDLQTGETTLVSVDSSGIQANNISGGPSISSDGRYVAFESEASNLVGGDTNGYEDVFVHDRQTGETIRVSVDSSGNQANASCYAPFISGDGHHVVFVSSATNLVAEDSDYIGDIYVHDMESGETSLVSVASDGTKGNSYSYYATISDTGGHVAYQSDSDNLVSGDTNSNSDAFVYGPRWVTLSHLSLLLRD